MALTVNEIRELGIAKDFRLAAGATGLNRMVERVNMMDFEYDTWEPDAKKSDGMFDEKSIVISSLIFAKEKPEKILSVIRQLYMDGISAIAIKTVYYQELPQKVMDYANEKSLPIFFFDSEKNFSDDIVVGLTMALEEHNNIDVLEEKLFFLLQRNLGTVNRIKLVEELFLELKEPFQCFYYMEKEVHSSLTYYRRIKKLREKKGRNMIILPYQSGILVTVYGIEKVDPKDIAEGIELVWGQYYCGGSKLCRKREEIAHKIREALYACNFGKDHDKNICFFDEMGIWQVILPNQENYWMKSYCNSVVEKLRSYDMDGNSEMYDTVVSYVKNGCDVNRTAQDMVVHKNTVRYRINKAKEILNLEKEGSGFNEIIFFAVYFMEAGVDHILID